MEPPAGSHASRRCGCSCLTLLPRLALRGLEERHVFYPDLEIPPSDWSGIRPLSKHFSLSPQIHSMLCMNIVQSQSSEDLKIVVKIENSQ